MYALVVPDEIGRTTSYTLNLGSATNVTIYQPQAGSTDMMSTTMNTTQGKITLNVTETPMFVTTGTGSPRLAVEEVAQTLHTSVTVYPNPSTDHITITGESASTDVLEVNVFDANLGTLRKQAKLNKSDRVFSGKIDVSALPFGMYIIEIKQGNDRAFRKIIKE